ncbi:MAG: YgaP family membrane protein [Syntrophobacteraceae bacterium]
MEKKLGGIDRALRFILGIVVAMVGVFAQLGATVRAVLLAVGIVVLATAFTGVSLLWSILGVDTRSEKSKKEEK